jgi:tetratricopeptide (TPR) repeat protein
MMVAGAGRAKSLLPLTRNSQHLLITAGLLLVTFLVHARAVGFGFCDLDDIHQIVENPTLQWKSAPDYFVKDVWRNPQAQYRTYYRPVFLLWLLVNLKLFGLHPALWHFAALALHGIVVVLVYRLGLRLMGNELIAVAAALLFAVHPTHVESVVWLSGITEPLAGVFFLGAFLQYLRWRDPRTRPMLSCAILCGLFTLLALLAKETSAALPLLIALYEGLFPSAPAENIRPRVVTAARAVGPAFAGAAVYACMRLFAMHHVVFVNNPPGRVLMTWPLLLWDYLRMMVWPFGLAVYYDAQLLNHPSIAQFWLPLAFLIVCAALLIFAFFRNKLAAFLACWWLFPIVPALVGLFSFPANDILHDRYTYLSSVAFVLLLAWGLSRLADIGVSFRLPVAIVFLALVCGWGVLTARQTQVWSNGFTLYENGITVSPNNVRVRNLLAIQLFKAGEARQAFALWDSTLKLDPDAFDTNFALGVTLFTVGKFPQAEFFLRRACELDRRKPEAFLNLADLLLAENRRDQALEVLHQALSTVDANPDLLRQKIVEIETAK